MFPRYSSAIDFPVTLKLRLILLFLTLLKKKNFFSGRRKRFFTTRNMYFILYHVYIYLHSNHMRRYWFYLKNHFRNFYKIFTL